MDFDQLHKTYPHRMLDAIECQSHTYRCNTTPMLKMPCDAAHVGRAVMILTMVLRDLSASEIFVNPMTACMLFSNLALHDIGESITGDVLYETKQHVPQVNAYESTVVEHLYGKELGFLLQQPLCHPWTLLLSAVDQAEFVMTCTTEAELGNTRIEPWMRKGLVCLQRPMNKMQEEWPGANFLTLEAIYQRGSRFA